MTPTGAIDVHTHVLPVRWPDYAARHGGARWPRLEGDPASACRFFVGDAFDRTLGPEAFDPLRRIAHLDRCGIAGQVLSPPPDLFCYFADPAGALDFCRLQNDNIARLVTAHPTRFIGAGTLPLQAPALAVKELERLVTDLGIRCIEVGSNVDGRDLDDESLVEVWAAAAARDVSVFVHPVAPVLAPERLRKHRLNQAVGFPLETALAMSRVVYGGIVERWPDLRWCWAHGGG
ncbi:MAG: amidohydrolase family protein, partial [Candidatus Rokubacteria bacterium]|nr:amidohydrolase family protein [Candidatus Rokubacteria bacterium]